MAKKKPLSIPPQALDDPFRPPDEPRMVRCLHCKRTYNSSRMRWMDGLWRCGIEGCDGRGYTFDIFDVDDPMWNAEPPPNLLLHMGHDVRLIPLHHNCETFYCLTCDEWINPKCDDQQCAFCTTRPDKPSMMTRKDLDSSPKVVMMKPEHGNLVDDN